MILPETCTSLVARVGEQGLSFVGFWELHVGIQGLGDTLGDHLNRSSRAAGSPCTAGGPWHLRRCRPCHPCTSTSPERRELSTKCGHAVLGMGCRL